MLPVQLNIHLLKQYTELKKEKIDLAIAGHELFQATTGNEGLLLCRKSKTFFPHNHSYSYILGSISFASCGGYAGRCR
jgi:hypothetical protein